MLTKKVLLFNKLVKLNFFYSVNKRGILGLDIISIHRDCFLLDLDKLLHFLFKLIPFFFDLILKQGCVFFVGVNFMLLKWFSYDKALYKQYDLIATWKGGTFSNFFNINIRTNFLDISHINKLPMVFIFLNFDKNLIVFNEVNSYHLPIIGLFEKIINPNLIYCFGNLSLSLFISCFFFKIFARFLKNIA